MRMPQDGTSLVAGGRRQRAAHWGMWLLFWMVLCIGCTVAMAVASTDLRLTVQ